MRWDEAVPRAPQGKCTQLVHDAFSRPVSLTGGARRRRRAGTDADPPSYRLARPFLSSAGNGLRPRWRRTTTRPPTGGTLAAWSRASASASASDPRCPENSTSPSASPCPPPTRCGSSPPTRAPSSVRARERAKYGPAHRAVPADPTAPAPTPTSPPTSIGSSGPRPASATCTGRFFPLSTGLSRDTTARSSPTVR